MIAAAELRRGCGLFFANDAQFDALGEIDSVMDNSKVRGLIPPIRESKIGKSCPNDISKANVVLITPTRVRGTVQGNLASKCCETDSKLLAMDL